MDYLFILFMIKASFFAGINQGINKLLVTTSLGCEKRAYKTT